MSSTYGENLKLSIFGQSHGPAIGMILDGIPAGLPVNYDALLSFMGRRSPGNNNYSSSRAESDYPEFLGGILNGFTCGAPVAAVIHNQDTRSNDYSQIKDCPRPGHADFTAQIKYGGFQDKSGGGHFSGRLTAPLCIAGGLCIQWLNEMGITIGARIKSVGDCCDYFDPDPTDPGIESIHKDFPVFSADAGEKMRNRIAAARDNGDSIGGIIECFIEGVPAGIGEPMFGGVESRIAQIVYGIPGVKCVEFGLGRKSSLLFGSDHNDEFVVEEGVIRTLTNHCGGILGGITTGMPVIFSVAIKPTPSIPQAQNTVNISTNENTVIITNGRHDPCIVPRAVPVVEAAAALAIFDLILGNTQTSRRK